jgi:hypothetical protein
MTSITSGTLVYWNIHSGFGEIDLDSGYGRVGIYRADLLRAGVRSPKVGDRFYFNTDTTANGVTVAIDLCPDVGGPEPEAETMRIAVQPPATRLFWRYGASRADRERGAAPASRNPVLPALLGIITGYFLGGG